MSLKPNDPWLVPFFSLIRKRPGMYVGTEEIQEFTLYLTGYITARRELGFPAFGRGEENLLDDFTIWLRMKCPQNRNASCGWSGLIWLMDDSRKSVRTFLTLFDEFLHERGLALSDDLAAAYEPHWNPLSKSGESSGDE